MPGVLVALLAVCATPAVAAEPTDAPTAACAPLDVAALAARIVPSIESYTLANGLRVHLVPRAADATVAVRVAYDVGARDEEPGRSGTAHLFEHLMFKGSERVGDGVFFRIARDAGGRTNASTDYDLTQYWATVAPAALDRVLFAEADRMRGLRLDEASLASQRAAIDEERGQLYATPGVAAAEAFGIALWEGTPYGHSVIGGREELDATTLDEAMRFHRLHYAPSNAVLVLVGGFDVAAARASIAAHFGALPARPGPPPRAPFALEARPLARRVVDARTPFPVYAIVWHGVGATHADALAVAVVDELLMGASDGRLTRAVARPLAFDAFALPAALRDVGLLDYVFAPRTFASFREIERAVRGEARALRERGPGAAELCRARRQEQRERLAALDANEGVAAAIAAGTLVHGDALRALDELARLDALDAGDVRRVAARVLVDASPTLAIAPTGALRWLKPILEILPASVGAALERSLL